MSEPLETDQLANLIAAKHKLLTQLQILSKRQLETISQNDASLLLRMLSAKQKMLDHLQTIESQLNPYRSQDPQSRQWRTQQDRQNTAQLAKQCELLLTELMTLEKQGEAVLRRRRDEAAQQLQGAHNAEQARKAYVRPVELPRNQLDMSSES